jgi:hypothetical protein
VADPVVMGMTHDCQKKVEAFFTDLRCAGLLLAGAPDPPEQVLGGVICIAPDVRLT